MSQAGPDGRPAVPAPLAEALAGAGLRPRFALVLGSGLGGVADQIERTLELPYAEIPGFPRSTAPGHRGRLLGVTWAGQPILAFQGRFHLYEGYTAQQVASPARLAAALGCEALLLTNACGGLRPEWVPGELMLHRDFINLTGANPLTGPNLPPGPRFPVMFGAYDPDLAELARLAAQREEIPLREGVYLGIAGPSYASRAELAAYQRLGGDAIGMSTVLEVIAARQAGLRVLGLSTVTDLALPEAERHADEAEVLRVAALAAERMSALLRGVLARA